ncbi:UbiA prenyltransferase family-domain-containing protein [Cyathus striatus]|nr:UbiA prenyltransferase family-domain-containing protein [Cyathus striatus]
MDFNSFTALNSAFFLRTYSTLAALALITKRSFSKILYHITTIFLFSKSDVKTTIIPVGIFTLGMSPHFIFFYLQSVVSVLWIWIIVLQFNLYNQLYGLNEDKKNKPWRPLPSGRVTVRTVSILRCIATIMACFISWIYGIQVMAASSIFTILIFLYHTLHGDRHWMMKNILNAAGYGCLAWGSSLVASNDRSGLDWERTYALSLLVGVIATTIQAQDFQDTEGDRLMGRRTAPMIWPMTCRYTLLLILIIWATLLGHIWILSAIFRTTYIIVTFLVGGRFCFKTDPTDDEWSYFYYNMWLAFTLALPGYHRYYQETT